jgi:hypothetical protein
MSGFAYGPRLGRDVLARKIIETSDDCRQSYMRNVSQFNTAHENEMAERCANAASNTGYHLLRALGYSDDEMKDFRKECWS